MLLAHVAHALVDVHVVQEYKSMPVSYKGPAPSYVDKVRGLKRHAACARACELESACVTVYL